MFSPASPQTAASPPLPPAGWRWTHRTYRMYMMTPRDHMSQDLSYFSGPSTSGAGEERNKLPSQTGALGGGSNRPTPAEPRGLCWWQWLERCSPATRQSGCTHRHRTQSSPSCMLQRAANTAPTCTQSTQSGFAPSTMQRLKLQAGCSGDGLRMAPSKLPSSAPPPCKPASSDPPSHLPT